MKSMIFPFPDLTRLQSGALARAGVAAVALAGVLAGGVAPPREALAQATQAQERAGEPGASAWSPAPEVEGPPPRRRPAGERRLPRRRRNRSWTGRP